MKRILCAVLLAFSSLAIASDDPVKDTREILAGTVTTKTTKNAYLSGSRDATTAFKGALEAYKRVTGWKPPVVVPPIVTPPVACPEGQMLHDGKCEAMPPVTPPTPPVITPPIVAPGDIMVPIKGAGLLPIPSPFDPNLALTSAGGANWGVAQSAKPDVLGAVRLTCGSAGTGRFDPKVYPGDKTGKSHLHDFYGYVALTPDSTYESVRGAPASEGRSTCNYGPYTAQRSAYWQPAMLDGQGNVIRPDYVTIYYKRRPLTDPIVSDPNNPRYQGKGVNLPNGLFFIFGYDMITGKAPTGGVRFITVEPGSNGQPDAGPQTEFKTLKDAASSGKMYPGSSLWVRGSAPSCWDGERADSANHRDHMSYPGYGSWGYLKCDAAHPYVIVEYSLITTWRVQAGDDPKQWRFSSDEMHPELPAGSTYHGDIWFLWDPTVIRIAETAPNGCMEGLLNCSSGRLSQGVALKNAGAPMYPDAAGNLVTSWTVPIQFRKVPIPGPEANDRIIGPKYN